MQSIKHLKKDYVQLGNLIYKPYKICSLPTSFGMYEEDEFTGEKYAIIDEWFNYRGYNYIFDSVAKS